MDKNTIVGIVLMILVIIGFSVYNSHQSQEAAVASLPERTMEGEEEARSSASPQSARKEGFYGAADSSGLFFAARQGAEELITLENSRIRVTVSTKGAMVSSVELKEFKSYVDYHAGVDTALLLFDARNASLNLSLEAKAENYAFADYCFTPVSMTDSTLALRLEGAGGRAIEVDYTLLPDNYLLNASIRAEGMGNLLPGDGGKLSLDWRDRVRRLEKGFYFENLQSTLTYKTVSGNTEKLSQQSDDRAAAEEAIDWVAFKNQYFSAVLIAPESFDRGSFDSKQLPEDGRFLKDYKARLSATLTQENAWTFPLQFYFGPNNYRLLQSMECYRLGERDLDLQELVYLGWPLFKWINRFFTLYVFDFLTRIGLHMGLVLLIITLIMRVIVYPMTRKSFLASTRMRVLKPRVDEVAKRYPKPEEAMKKQQEMMMLYKQYGASPAAGCLPMLIQMPLWIAMFNFVPNAIELRQVAFLWADDLSTYDSLISWDASLPFIGNHLSLFCLLFCGTNVLYSVITMRQQRDTMSTEQAQQMRLMRWMMYLMPVVFFFMFNKYSAGLNFYYFISLLASALTMWYLRWAIDEKKVLAKMEAYYEANKSRPQAKPSGFMARLQALQEEQLHRQELQKKDKK